MADVFCYGFCVGERKKPMLLVSTVQRLSSRLFQKRQAQYTFLFLREDSTCMREGKTDKNFDLFVLVVLYFLINMGVISSLDRLKLHGYIRWTALRVSNSLMVQKNSTLHINLS